MAVPPRKVSAVVVAAGSLAAELAAYTRDVPDLRFPTPMVQLLFESLFFKLFSKGLDFLEDPKIATENKEFSRKLKILGSWGTNRLAEFLEIKPVFLKPGPNGEFAFKRSLDELEKLFLSRDPYSKLSFLIRAIAFMKTEGLRIYEPKAEISSMDEELPILILIITKIDPSTEIYTHTRLMRQYVNAKDDLDFESKMLATLEVFLSGCSGLCHQKLESRRTRIKTGTRSRTKRLKYTVVFFITQSYKSFFTIWWKKVTNL